MSIDLKSLERRFYSDGYRLVVHATANGFSRTSLRTAVQGMHRMVDEVIDSFSEYAGSQNQAPDCKKGCFWCCWQPVFALSYEFDNLKDFLTENFSAEELEQVTRRAAAKRQKLDNLKGEALLNSKYPCPLLSEGACIAYEARPVACRIYLSSDVYTCRQFYHEPENPESVPSLMDFPMRMGRIINEGFRAGLKAAGVKADEMRIEEGI